MSTTSPTSLVALLVASTTTHREAVLSTLRHHLQGNTTAEATLTLFASEPQDVAMQHRMAKLLEQHVGSTKLSALHAQLNQPRVSSSITASDNALVQDSGHRIIAPTGMVHAETKASTGGQIIGSSITIIGSGAPAVPSLAHPSTPSPTPRRLPTTLSADGQHFSYGHALLIGVGQYQRQSLTVPNMTTAHDAQALAEILCNSDYAAYPPAQVQLLLNAQATRSAILRALDTLAQRLQQAPNSTALIFFAGHGESVGQSYALLPGDVESTRLAETSVTADLFHTAIARIRQYAKRLVVMLNCCHAGGVGGSVLGGDADSTLSGAAPPSSFYQPLAVGSGQVVISSSRPEQKSGAISERDPQHSCFGIHLINALKGGAAGNDAGIGVFELFSYLRLHVPKDAAGITYGGKPLLQEPLFYASQLDDNIAVALRTQQAGVTLGVIDDQRQQIARLVEIECQMALLAHVPVALREERDRLLRGLEGML